MSQQNNYVFKISFLFFIYTINSVSLYNHDSTSYRNQTWMSSLDFGLLVRQMSILGTHNSLGFQTCPLLGFSQQCQSNSLQTQLESGIRAIDIRVKHTNNKFQLYDRSCNLNANFDNVLTTVKSFLTTYPTQTVLLHLVEEQNSSGCNRTFEDTYKSYNGNYTSLIWTPTTQDPQLGEVRGQIVLIQDFTSVGIYGLLYATFNSLSNKKFGTNWDLYDKWMDIKNFLNNANAAKKSQISFWTGHGGSYPYFVVSGKSSSGNGDPRLSTGLTTPGFKNSYKEFPRVACFIGICTIAFEGMNTMAYNYINSQNLAFTGIVFTDFYGDDLLKKIVDRNNAVYSICSTTQRTQGCTLCDLSANCLKCNTKMHYIYNTPTKTCLADKGYYLNSATVPTLCSTPMPGCLQCTSQSVCTVCDQINHYQLYLSECIAEPGYYLDIASVPVKCPQLGCAQCQDQDVCLVCAVSANFILNTTSNTTCQCDDLNHFIQATTTQACICQVSYYLTINNTCQEMPKCPDMTGGCLNCDAADVCTLCDTLNHFVSDPTNIYCVCDQLYYFDGVSCELCNLADAACDQCANADICLSCVDNFTLTNGLCSCSFQYYAVDSDTCNKCAVGCLVCTGLNSCTICDTSNNFTLSGGECLCIVGMFEQNGSCHLCNSMAGCTDCDNDGCTVCDAIFGFSLNNGTCLCNYGYFVNQMNICEKCMMQGCLNCINQAICIECNPINYFLNTSSICDDICGDGILIYAQCDDGNNNNGDGCSSQCNVQKDYTCTGGSRNSITSCSYSGPIYLTLSKTTKDQSENKLYVNLKISPNILSLQSLNFTSVIEPQFPYAAKNVTFDTTNGEIYFVFTYNESLNGKSSNDLSILFDPPVAQPEFFYMKKASANLPSVTSNNLALKYYDPGVYDLLNIMRILSQVTAYLYIAFFAISFLFVSKLIAIQLMLVPQITFGGLIMIQKLQSLMYPISSIFPVNGYNPLFNDNSDLPPQISMLNYEGEFLSNFNMNIAIIALPIIIGIALLVIGKYSSNQRFKKWSYLLLKEWTLAIFLVFQFQFTISLGIDILYGNSLIGKIIGGVLTICLISFAVLIYRKPLNFGEFKSYFHQEPRYLNYYIIVILWRQALASILIYLSSMQYCGFIAIGVVSLHLVYLLICRPYLNNIRPILNLVVAGGILGIESYYKLSYYSDEVSFITNYLPILIIGLLLLLLLVNIGFLIFQLKQNKKAQQINKYQKNTDQSFDQQMKQQFNKQMQVIAQIQLALNPVNLQNIAEKSYEEKDTDKSLYAGFTELKNIQKSLKMSKINDTSLLDDSQIFGI